ncbi:MAG: hypothetical protein PHS64_04665, partial [Candidatus Omnitrophica bacterium]|nr:hypothetical protein [Candidatus Omnitrophota bacterium]
VFGGEISSDYKGTKPANFRAIGGDYGTILRQDGANFYLLTTNSGDPSGSWTDQRPFVINDATGNVGLACGTPPSNVGIGTSTPVSKLHLANNVATYPLDDFSEYQMLLYQGATPANSYGLGIASNVLWFNTNGDIVFTRQGTETVRITNGNIQAQGYLIGNAGGAGGRLNDRGGDNRFSVDWSGSPNTLKFYIEDVNVKTFIIDNPLDMSKYLIHTTLEGPENAVFYRGEARLKRGVAEIVLPEYFEALTREESRTVLLTSVFQDVNEQCSSLAASKVKDGRFSVKAIDGNNLQQSFYWEVKAVRRDVPILLVQPDKEEVEVHGEGPYKYYGLKNGR